MNLEEEYDEEVAALYRRGPPPLAAPAATNRFTQDPVPILVTGLVAQHRRIGGLGLPGEVGQFGRGDPGHPGGGVADPVDPALLLGFGAELCYAAQAITVP